MEKRKNTPERRIFAYLWNIASFLLRDKIDEPFARALAPVLPIRFGESAMSPSNHSRNRGVFQQSLVVPISSGQDRRCMQLPENTAPSSRNATLKQLALLFLRLGVTAFGGFPGLILHVS